ncbi:DUF742 domain-containing protein [Pseudonocardia acaciae]|uniref:DUF742 domain-containing protein n=1 Tax=Pseudonocardia acaciae TaxID=551276 RepID=UPI000A7FE31E|nr:DUF742 domain-containing protein [Pseudonocardia acaciae]
MTNDPDGDERWPPEPTFADVMNGFSFGSSRGRRRRRGRDRDEPEEGEEAEPVGEVSIPVRAELPFPELARSEPEEPASGGLVRHEEVPLPPLESGSSAVRPYAWTGGRTRSGYHLEIETLVSTSPKGLEHLDMLQYEHRSVAELCEHARSVAEVAALLSVPLGVAKVLLGDMAGLGLVSVHQSVSGNGNAPDLGVMERVLSGLRRL